MGARVTSEDVGRARPLRVCVTGAECTGKTTLANTLGSYLGAPVVHEAVRGYFAEKAAQGDANVYAADLVRAVELQTAVEDAAPKDVPLLILDTDVYTVAIWQRRYFEQRNQGLGEISKERQLNPATCIDLYVLCGPEIPFEHDSVRGSDVERARMHTLFVEALTTSGRRFVVVEGSVQERCTRAVAEIEKLAAEQSRLELRTKT